jgi:transcriptional regulator with XRE-family HTH domain
MAVIRQIRVKAGVTQAELARLGGTSQPTIAAYESGAKVPSLRTLRRLARSMGFDLQIDVVPAMTREDRRSLFLHRHIAERLRTNPDAVISKARTNLDKMRRLHPGARAALDEWERILDGTPEELLRALTSTDPKARELRQLTPFAGVLEGVARAKAYAEFRQADSDR